jgi:hypothetical protein
MEAGRVSIKKGDTYDNTNIKQETETNYGTQGTDCRIAERDGVT